MKILVTMELADELVDALLALDDEITAHEIKAQQGKSELADWLSAAPAAVQDLPTWPDLKQLLAGGAPPPAALLFSALDKDGDGGLSRQELEQAPQPTPFCLLVYFREF